MSMIQPALNSKNEVDFAQKPTQSWKVGSILTIGKIINNKGESVTSLALEPQGIAHLISKEAVLLPDDVCGIAHVLTRKCNEGLLTLNIGIVDPGWNNELSTPILNFSSERRLLQVGEPFIRLTLHRISMEPLANKPELGPTMALNTAKYEQEVCARAVGSFGKHFLDIRRLVGKAFKKENGKLRIALLKYLPIAAFALTIFALLVTIGIAGMGRLAVPNRDDQEIEIGVLKDRLLRMDVQNKSIQAMLANIQIQLQSQSMRTLAPTVSSVASPRHDAKKKKP